MKSQLTDWQMFELVGRIVSGLAGGACAVIGCVLGFFVLRRVGAFLPDLAEPLILVAVVLGGGALGAFVDLVGWRRRRDRWFESTGGLPPGKSKGVKA